MVLGKRRRGRILAVKWGMNPNSSSLGVDVTFLLFGAAALTVATPLVSAILRLKRAGASAEGEPGQAETNSDDSSGSAE